MNPTTLTMAGHLAHAGAARPAAVYASSAASLAMGGHGTHQASTWTKGAIAETTTFVVFDRKNRPPRPLSELSP